MADPYYNNPYGNVPPYQGGYRDGGSANYQGNGQRYSQYREDQPRQDYQQMWNDNRSWQEQPYQDQRSGYYDQQNTQSGYMRPPSRNQRYYHGDNRGYGNHRSDRPEKSQHREPRYQDPTPPMSVIHAHTTGSPPDPVHLPATAERDYRENSPQRTVEIPEQVQVSQREGPEPVQESQTESPQPVQESRTENFEPVQESRTENREPIQESRADNPEVASQQYFQEAPHQDPVLSDISDAENATEEEKDNNQVAEGNDEDNVSNRDAISQTDEISEGENDATVGFSEPVKEHIEQEKEEERRESEQVSESRPEQAEYYESTEDENSDTVNGQENLSQHENSGGEQQANDAGERDMAAEDTDKNQEEVERNIEDMDTGEHVANGNTDESDPPSEIAQDGNDSNEKAENTEEAQNETESNDKEIQHDEDGNENDGKDTDTTEVDEVPQEVAGEEPTEKQSEDVASTSKGDEPDDATKDVPADSATTEEPNTEDLIVTGEELGRRKRRGRSAAVTAQPVTPMVLGTVQSTSLDASDTDNQEASQNENEEGVKVKEENGPQAVTKWIVGKDGELVRASEHQDVDTMESEFPTTEPWTAPSFNQASEELPQMPQDGFLVQIEDLRQGEETLEDVSELLHIPTEAVDLWRGTKKCPVVNCKGPALTLKHFFDWHWYVFHEQLIKVYYCPVNGCQRNRERWNSRRKRDLVSHLKQKHEVEKLPDAIETQIVKNPNYKPPTNFVVLPASKKKKVQAEKEKAADTTKSAAEKPSKRPFPELLISHEGVRTEEIQTTIPEEMEEAWKRMKYCPAASCPKTKIQYYSELKRHWKTFHVQHSNGYLCPDGSCVGNRQVRKKNQPFQSTHIPGIINHLIGPSHRLTKAEAQQVGSALVPTLLDNPSYLMPILRDEEPAEEPAPKKPKVAKAPPKAVEKPVVEQPRTPRLSRTRSDSPITPASEPTRGRARSRIPNKRYSDYAVESVVNNSTPPQSDTESVPDTRKRGRPQRVKSEPPAKRSKQEDPAPIEVQPPANIDPMTVSIVGQSDITDFENAKDEIIPPEFLEWWSPKDGCPSLSCPANVCHFFIHDLIRHWKLKHMQFVPSYHCPTVTCEYATKNKASLRKHLTSKHNTRVGALNNVLSKAKAEFVENSDYLVPVPPSKTKAKGKTPAKRPIVPVAKTRSTRQDPAPEVIEEVTPLPEPVVFDSRSRSGKPRQPLPEKLKARSRSSVGLAEEKVQARASKTGESEDTENNLEQLAWQPTVNLATLPKKVNRVDVRSKTFSEIIKRGQMAIISPPVTPKRVSPKKQSPSKRSSQVTFEADDDDDNDNFGVMVPMPSMEDAGIAINIQSHTPSGKRSPGQRAALKDSGSDLKDQSYNAAIQALHLRQQELERKLAQASQPAVSSDVLKKITDLQAQNEALRFQNEALRKQLMSGAMAQKWEDEKRLLQQQVEHKDITISTLQDVIARLGAQSPTSNTITNQMINLPTRPSTRSNPGFSSPETPQLAITPRAGYSKDGNRQQCSVALKTGAKVNFEYDSFQDFMQKIGTLNDQYGLNE